MDGLVGHYQKKFGMTIEKLSAIQLDSSFIDKRRNQMVAQELIALIKQKYPMLRTDPNAIIIGLTQEDMYIQNYPWRFAFTFRQEDRFAVVSTARMNPINFGLPDDEALLSTRLRKTVTRDIGILYYRKSQNGNPQSVLYSSLGGLEELDGMNEEF